MVVVLQLNQVKTKLLSVAILTFVFLKVVVSLS